MLCEEMAPIHCIFFVAQFVYKPLMFMNSPQTKVSLLILISKGKPFAEPFYVWDERIGGLQLIKFYDACF